MKREKSVTLFLYVSPRVLNYSRGSHHPSITLADTEEVLKKTAIAYHQHLFFLLGFGWYAIAVLF